jgi:hypothetical protein
MNFTDQSPSTQWSALKFRGDKFAEVWFKPEGKRFGLMFRIPRETYQIPGMAQRLTAENLLKAVAIPPGEVEAWCFGSVSLAGQDGCNPELRQPLPPPASDMSHLTIYVNLKPPPDVTAPQESSEPGLPAEKLQDLEARWTAILGLEAGLDHLRLTVESAHSEMETGIKRTLTTEEKLNALNADVMPWNKAKSRARFAMPKAREFIHRATWAMDTSERKKLGELFKEGVPPDLPAAQMEPVLAQLEKLLKDRQVLSAHGAKVFQECKSITADIQGALRTLLSNAARNAKRKKAAGKAKGKFFKDVRRWTGVE